MRHRVRPGKVQLSRIDQRLGRFGELRLGDLECGGGQGQRCGYGIECGLGKSSCLESTSVSVDLVSCGLATWSAAAAKGSVAGTASSAAWGSPAVSNRPASRLIW